MTPKFGDQIRVIEDAARMRGHRAGPATGRPAMLVEVYRDVDYETHGSRVRFDFIRSDSLDLYGDPHTVITYYTYLKYVRPIHDDRPCPPDHTSVHWVRYNTSGGRRYEVDACECGRVRKVDEDR